MLQVKNMVKYFGKVEVLKGITLEVNSGEVVVVVGPSGGGKTTMLRIINNLTKCDKGDILIDGMYICKNGKYEEKSTIKKLNRKIGMVFQGFNLFPHMNVIENIIEAPIRVLGITKEDAKREGVQILKFLGLEDKEVAYPYELSGGQKQRVAIGRALALKPKLICFDEPTSALDPELTKEIATLIRKLTATGVAALIITHDMDFAKMVADRVVSMDKGKIIEGDIYDKGIESIRLRG